MLQKQEMNITCLSEMIWEDFTYTLPHIKPWVAEWIAYHLLDLKVAGSNSGGDIFPTLITLNYSLTITQAN